MSQNPIPRPQAAAVPAPIPTAPRAVAAPSVLPLHPVAPPVQVGRPRRRHGLVLISLFLLVILPAALMAGYLWRHAADQYASNLGFSVRQEENTTAFELFGGMTALSGSSSSDTDILYQFLQSQDLVAVLDQRLDLRQIWSRPEEDPVFAFQPPGTIEDLRDYWGRMVRVSHDSSTGLIEVRALAFDPVDAQRITQEIFAESSRMINELSDIARDDAIRYARADLDAAEARLRDARQMLTTFRNRHQIVDPTLDTQSQMGLVTTLQEQLAQAMIELDLLRQTTRAADPRIKTAEMKIQVVQGRIQDERNKLGLAGDGDQGGAFASLVGEYERLAVDREFAEQAYTTALAAFDAARSEAQRQSRYLAAHIRPTLPEQAEYPQRLILWSVAVMFLALVWSVMVLVGYSLRDRR